MGEAGGGAGLFISISARYQRLILVMYLVYMLCVICVIINKKNNERCSHSMAYVLYNNFFKCYCSLHQDKIQGWFEVGLNSYPWNYFMFVLSRVNQNPQLTSLLWLPKFLIWLSLILIVIISKSLCINEEIRNSPYFIHIFILFNGTKRKIFWDLRSSLLTQFQLLLQ